MNSRAGPSFAGWRRRAGRLRRRSAGLRQSARTTASADPVPTRPGRAPDVALESTHLGSVMDEAVLRAKRRMRIGADPDYDLLYENFDVLHYLLQSPDLIDRPDVDLIDHFLEHGRAKGLSPHPDFSMTEYVRRYPHRTAPERVRNPFLFWLKHGRAAGDIADPAPRIRRIAPVLGMSPEQVAELLTERRRDLQQRFRTGRLGEVFARAAEIEPLIGATWTEIARPHLTPVSRPLVVEETCVLYHAQEAAGFQRARVVLVLNPARQGAGRRMAGHFARALATHIDAHEIVVIYTDGTADAPVGRYPGRVREIDFAKIAEQLPDDWAEHALVTLLRTFRADAVVNVDSALLHNAMRSYGRALAATERLFVCFFRNEQTALGGQTDRGIADLYRTFDYVAGVIAEDPYVARELTRTYRVPQQDRQRIHVLPTPVEPAWVADVLLTGGGAGADEDAAR